MGPASPSERERVIDQFYRLKGGGRRPEGTGMGLSICRGIVAALRGNLRVETTPGGGSFVLTLPIAHHPARPGGPGDPEFLAGPESPGSARPSSGPPRVGWERRESPEAVGRREGRT
jgi:hypothetical protein